MIAPSILFPWNPALGTLLRIYLYQRFRLFRQIREFEVLTLELYNSSFVIDPSCLTGYRVVDALATLSTPGMAALAPNQIHPGWFDDSLAYIRGSGRAVKEPKPRKLCLTLPSSIFSNQPRAPTQNGYDRGFWHGKVAFMARTTDVGLAIIEGTPKVSLPAVEAHSMLTIVSDKPFTLPIPQILHTSQASLAPQRFFQVVSATCIRCLITQRRHPLLPRIAPNTWAWW
mmetsp:Transcript_30693/g.49325  ORF Transcript_30693/g.49325 Transcript_30693/m.49325 type:complete len:228 (-) Transcript_30693:1589-2272(-)